MSKNYLQNYNDPTAPMENEELMDPYAQQYQETESYNPYYKGIREAIDSHRQNTRAGKNSSNRWIKSLLAFGQNLNEQPKGGGLAAVGSAMGPAALAYMGEEEREEKANEAVLKQILEQKKIEDDRIAQQIYKRQEYENAKEDRLERNRHNLAQESYQNASLAEDRRNHGLMYDAKLAGDQHGKGDPETLNRTFDLIEAEIDKLGKEGKRGSGYRIIDKFTPGGASLSEEQTQIDTLNKALQGALFGAWGYTSQAEFHSLPQLSVYNTPEQNKSVTKQLRNITKLKTQNNSPRMPIDDRHNQTANTSLPQENNSEWIIIEGPKGERREVYFEDVDRLLKDPAYKRVE